MVQLVEKLPPEHEQTQMAAIQVQYAFALNRRNQPGDRDRALKILNRVSLLSIFALNSWILRTHIRMYMYA